MFRKSILAFCEEWKIRWWSNTRYQQWLCFWSGNRNHYHPSSNKVRQQRGLSSTGLCIVPLNAERDSIMQLQSLMIEMHKFVSIVDCINSICWLFYFNPSSSSMNSDWCNLDWISICDCINSICWLHHFIIEVHQFIIEIQSDLATAILFREKSLISESYYFWELNGVTLETHHR